MDHSRLTALWIGKFGFQFRLIHDVKLVARGNVGLDMILVAGREGVATLWFDQFTGKKWEYAIVGQGLPQSDSNNPFWGSALRICGHL